MDMDVRIIAATNVDVEKALQAKTFRSDLYYRLAIIPIHIPPLRERKEDIPLLTAYFMTRFSAKNPVALSPTEIDKLTSYNWPGNIRELSNIIERAVILRTGDEIHPSTLIKTTVSEPVNGVIHLTHKNCIRNNFTTLKLMEENHIRLALDQVSGNYTQAAKLLGISRSTLMRKLQAYTE
jgi:transcriptional regulator with PAS, ATPase and Fis domain